MDAQKETFWTKRRVVLAAVAGAVLLLVVGALVAWVIMSQPARNEPKAKQSDIDKAAQDAKQAAADGKLQEAAAQTIQDKKPADAEKVYQDAISAAATTERKTLLYIDLSGVYYKAGLYDQAFAVAAKAETANPDKFLIADWLSRLYEDQKNYAKAAEYYTLAGKWADSPQNKTAINKAYYDGKAAEMTKLAQGTK